MNVLIILLIGALVIATASFAVMGFAHGRRMRWLARKANEMGMRFSPDDPFDIPRRYAELAPFHRGHSAQAHNVTYGRVDGMPIRSFDFRYEIGHGTRRMTRKHWIIVLETDLAIPQTILWSDLDGDLAPLEARTGGLRLEGWFFRGDRALGEALGRTCRCLADEGVSVQTCRNLLMLCLPVHGRRKDYAAHLGVAAAALRAAAQMARARPAACSPAAGPDAELTQGNVENHLPPC